ncbi:hypothetical protein CYMTET_52329 [Cymbomonas tetramitiformis]|uniref:Uncharacterized protein n=1 Tax=Cymbomonas tetramitiformis TaxID=36881 RepID=A0AAE0ERG2_9CHLO|nr:hypothetical protein CYMTET_52329 [Cymbomonas tetramitiformis]
MSAVETRASLTCGLRRDQRNSSSVPSLNLSANRDMTATAWDKADKESEELWNSLEDLRTKVRATRAVVAPHAAAALEMRRTLKNNIMEVVQHASNISSNLSEDAGTAPSSSAADIERADAQLNSVLQILYHLDSTISLMEHPAEYQSLETLAMTQQAQLEYLEQLTAQVTELRERMPLMHHSEEQATVMVGMCDNLMKRMLHMKELLQEAQAKEKEVVHMHLEAEQSIQQQMAEFKLRADALGGDQQSQLLSQLQEVVAVTPEPRAQLEWGDLESEDSERWTKAMEMHLEQLKEIENKVDRFKKLSESGLQYMAAGPCLSLVPAPPPLPHSRRSLQLRSLQATLFTWSRPAVLCGRPAQEARARHHAGAEAGAVWRSSSRPLAPCHIQTISFSTLIVHGTPRVPAEREAQPRGVEGELDFLENHTNDEAQKLCARRLDAPDDAPGMLVYELQGVSDLLTASVKQLDKMTLLEKGVVVNKAVIRQNMGSRVQCIEDLADSCRRTSAVPFQRALEDIHRLVVVCGKYEETANLCVAPDVMMEGVTRERVRAAHVDFLQRERQLLEVLAQRSKSVVAKLRWLELIKDVPMNMNAIKQLATSTSQLATLLGALRTNLDEHAAQREAVADEIKETARGALKMCKGMSLSRQEEMCKVVSIFMRAVECRGEIWRLEGRSTFVERKGIEVQAGKSCLDALENSVFDGDPLQQLLEVAAEPTPKEEEDEEEDEEDEEDEDEMIEVEMEVEEEVEITDDDEPEEEVVVVEPEKKKGKKGHKHKTKAAEGGSPKKSAAGAPHHGRRPIKSARIRSANKTKESSANSQPAPVPAEEVAQEPAEEVAVEGEHSSDDVAATEAAPHPGPVAVYVEDEHEGEKEVWAEDEPVEHAEETALEAAAAPGSSEAACDEDSEDDTAAGVPGGKSERAESGSGRGPRSPKSTRKKPKPGQQGRNKTSAPSALNGKKVGPQDKASYAQRFETEGQSKADRKSKVGDAPEDAPPLDQPAEDAAEDAPPLDQPAEDAAEEAPLSQLAEDAAEEAPLGPLAEDAPEDVPPGQPGHDTSDQAPPGQPAPEPPVPADDYVGVDPPTASDAHGIPLHTAPTVSDEEGLEGAPSEAVAGPPKKKATMSMKAKMMAMAPPPPLPDFDNIAPPLEELSATSPKKATTTKKVVVKKQMKMTQMSRKLAMKSGLVSEMKPGASQKKAEKAVRMAEKAAKQAEKTAQETGAQDSLKVAMEGSNYLKVMMQALIGIATAHKNATESERELGDIKLKEAMASSPLLREMLKKALQSCQSVEQGISKLTSIADIVPGSVDIRLKMMAKKRITKRGVGAEPKSTPEGDAEALSLVDEDGNMKAPEAGEGESLSEVPLEPDAQSGEEETAEAEPSETDAPQSVAAAAMAGPKETRSDTSSVVPDDGRGNFVVKDGPGSLHLVTDDLKEEDTWSMPSPGMLSPAQALASAQRHGQIVEAEEELGTLTHMYQEMKDEHRAATGLTQLHKQPRSPLSDTEMEHIKQSMEFGELDNVLDLRDDAPIVPKDSLREQILQMSVYIGGRPALARVLGPLVGAIFVAYHNVEAQYQNIEARSPQAKVEVPAGDIRDTLEDVSDASAAALISAIMALVSSDLDEVDGSMLAEAAAAKLGEHAAVVVSAEAMQKAAEEVRSGNSILFGIPPLLEALAGMTSVPMQGDVGSVLSGARSLAQTVAAADNEEKTARAQEMKQLYIGAEVQMRTQQGMLDDMMHQQKVISLSLHELQESTSGESSPVAGQMEKLISFMDQSSTNLEKVAEQNVVTNSIVMKKGRLMSKDQESSTVEAGAGPGADAEMASRAAGEALMAAICWSGPPRAPTDVLTWRLRSGALQAMETSEKLVTTMLGVDKAFSPTGATMDSVMNSIFKFSTRHTHEDLVKVVRTILHHMWEDLGVHCYLAHSEQHEDGLPEFMIECVTPGHPDGHDDGDKLPVDEDTMPYQAVKNASMVSLNGDSHTEVLRRCWPVIQHSHPSSFTDSHYDRAWGVLHMISTIEQERVAASHLTSLAVALSKSISQPEYKDDPLEDTVRDSTAKMNKPSAVSFHELDRVERTSLMSMRSDLKVLQSAKKRVEKLIWNSKRLRHAIVELRSYKVVNRTAVSVVLSVLLLIGEHSLVGLLPPRTFSLTAHQNGILSIWVQIRKVFDEYTQSKYQNPAGQLDKNDAGPEMPRQLVEPDAPNAKRGGGRLTAATHAVIANNAMVNHRRYSILQMVNDISSAVNRKQTILQRMISLEPYKVDMSTRPEVWQALKSLAKQVDPVELKRGFPIVRYLHTWVDAVLGMLHLERQIENMKRGPIQDEDAANEDEHESFQSFSLERLENNNQAIMQAIAQMPSPRKKSLGRSDSQLEMIPQPESRPYVAPGLTIKTLGQQEHPSSGRCRSVSEPSPYHRPSKSPVARSRTKNLQVFSESEESDQHDKQTVTGPRDSKYKM